MIRPKPPPCMLQAETFDDLIFSKTLICPALIECRPHSQTRSSNFSLHLGLSPNTVARCIPRRCGWSSALNRVARR